MLKNWNIRRILYFLGGLLFIVIAVKDSAWWMSIFGVYFVAMAIFRFGCAAGNCTYTRNEKEENFWFNKKY